MMRPKGISRSWRVGLIAVVVLLFSGMGFAQVETTGRIVGVITDPSGAVVSGASITATNDATRIASGTQSNEEGFYSLSTVRIGTYTLTVTANGFKGQVVKSLMVQLNTTTPQNVILRVGEASETVTVTSESSLAVIDTTSAQLATNINTELLQGLPNLSRDMMTTVSMLPGVYATTGAPTNNTEGDWAGANGLTVANSTFTVDGADNASAWLNAINQMPNPDAVEEVQVVTSGGEAQMGAGPGLNVNVVTKSGTNTFHGSGFYQLHSKKMNANTWFNNNQLVPEPGDNQRWDGATLGGPVFVPHVYHGRDKTFFFFSTQHWQNPQPFNVAGTHGLTADMVKGDFSAIGGSSGQDCVGACSGFQIYDPLTGQPFAGNVIPQSRMNQLSKAMVADKLFDDKFGLVSQFGDREVWPWMGSLLNTEWTLKLDHQLTKNQKATFMMYRTWGSNTAPAYLSSLPAWGMNQTAAEQRDYSIHHTWTPRSNLILETAYHNSFRPVPSGQTGQLVQKNYQAYTPNFGEAVAGKKSAEYLPNLLLGDFWSNMGGYEDWPSETDQRIMDITEGVSYYKGKHSFKAGFEYKRRWLSQMPIMDRAEMQFVGNFSSAPSGTDPATGKLISGNFPGGTLAGAYSWADFLLGTASNVQVGTPLFYQSSHIEHYIYYLSDQWKVAPKLTLSLGLRSGYDPNFVQEQGLTSGFKAGEQSRYSNLPLGLVTVGDPGIPTGFFEMPHVSVSPRVGVAYDLGGNGTTVITAAAGIYFQDLPGGNAAMTTGTVPFGGWATAPNAFDIYNPWVTSCQSPTQCTPGSAQATWKQNPLPLSQDPAKFVNPGPNNSISVGSYDMPVKLPRTLQMNLGIQHKLIQGVTVRVGYVGNRQTHVQYLQDQNHPIWQTGATIANETARRPYNYFGAVITTYSNAHSRYDSMQATMSVNRFGFNGSVNYTLQQSWAPWSQNGQDFATNHGYTVQNTYDMNSDYSEGANRQSFNAYMLYSIPKPRLNVQSGNDASRWALWSTNYIARDWMVGGNFTASSGAPLNVTWGVDQLMDGLSVDRPNLAGKVQINKHPQANTTDRYIDYKAFAAPPVPTASAPHAFGNLPNNAFWGPGAWGLSATLTRAFPIKERMNFKLKVDASNVLNHPILASPNTSLGGFFDASGNPAASGQVGTPGAGNFGTIGSKYGQRAIGLEGRFVF